MGRAGPVIAIALLVGCGDDLGGARCELGTAASALTADDRHAIGPAAPYAPDLDLAGRDDALRTSIAARRAAAWQVVARALTPVPLADPTLAAALGGAPTIPAWQTWYGRDDLDRVFKHAYRALTPAARRARAPLDDARLDEALGWNAQPLDAGTPEARYLASLRDPTEVGGVAGIGRVSYSPGALRHLVRRYAAIARCVDAGAPPVDAEAPIRVGAVIAHVERVALPACGWRVLGPYVATDDFAVDGVAYVRRGAPPTATAFDCHGPACVLHGGGAFYVAVASDAPREVALALRYREADAPTPACLDGAPPRDAVLVKAEWRRVTATGLPTYRTDAAALAARVAGGSWGDGDGRADPDPASAYTVTLPGGARFRLAALHLATKELDHWMWITLWWSADPDRDLGGDRPPAIAGPWRHYQMCVSTAYAEGDPDPRGGAAGSLGDALAAVSRPGEPTWCSNPYLEHGDGNAATNCIGCHQHGGTGASVAGILDALPHHGATRVRVSAPTDYAWALTDPIGDDVGAAIAAELAYWDASDPP